MERPIKERMIGAGILVLAGVILIPWLLEGASTSPSTTEQVLILPGSDTQKNETRTVSLIVPSQGTTKPSEMPTLDLDRPEVKEMPAALEAAVSSSQPKTLPVESSAASTVTEVAPQQVSSAAESREPPVTSSPEKEQPIIASNHGDIPPPSFDTQLEEAAAEKLEEKPEVVRPKPVAGTANAPTEVAKAWAVQVGAFASKENAERLAERLRNKNYKAFVMRNVVEGRVRFRVRVGPVPQRAQAELLAAALKEDRQPAKVLSHP